MNARTPAVIVDVDGTLCDVSSVLHHITTPGQTKDFAAFHREAMHCPPTEWVLDWCRFYAASNCQIVIVTGRKYTWERETRKWLDRQDLPTYTGPFMRGDDDNRPDTEVKRDIYDLLVGEHGFEIVAAIDDRPSVVRLWNSLDIPTTVVHRPDWEDAGESYDGVIADNDEDLRNRIAHQGLKTR